MAEENFLNFLDDLPRGAEFPFPVPGGFRLVSYNPVAVPFKSPLSTVINAEKYIVALLVDASMRLAHPRTYSCPSMGEILSKLEAAGVKMEVVL